MAEANKRYWAQVHVIWSDGQREWHYELEMEPMTINQFKVERISLVLQSLTGDIKGLETKYYLGPEYRDSLGHKYRAQKTETGDRKYWEGEVEKAGGKVPSFRVDDTVQLTEESCLYYQEADGDDYTRLILKIKDTMVFKSRYDPVLYSFSNFEHSFYEFELERVN